MNEKYQDTSSEPLCGNISFCPPTHLLMDIQVVHILALTNKAAARICVQVLARHRFHFS